MFERRLKLYQVTYNAHDSDVDHRDKDCSGPLQLRSHDSSLDNDGNAVDDDLEQ